MNGMNVQTLKQILRPVEDSPVVGFKTIEGNFNDHCFVTLRSGNKYVIRICKNGWTRSDWAIAKFMREQIVADLIREGLGIATPRTLFIDGSLRECDFTFAIQKPLARPLLSFSQALREAPEAQQRELLRLYGSTAHRIHQLRMPPFKHYEHTVHFNCQPFEVRCQPEFAEGLLETHGGTWLDREKPLIRLESALFHRGEYVDHNIEQLMEAVKKGLKACVEQDQMKNDSAEKLIRIIEAHRDVLKTELARHHLCHGDFHFGNIFVDRGEAGWRIAGLLDFEIAFIGSPYQEFFKAEQWSFGPEMLKGFRNEIVSGYGKGLEKSRYGLLFLCALIVSDWGRKRLADTLAKDPRCVLDEELNFLELW